LVATGEALCSEIGSTMFSSEGASDADGLAETDGLVDVDGETDAVLDLDGAVSGAPDESFPPKIVRPNK
jgi:hypothetical protein